MNEETPKRALGRGLHALLSSTLAEPDSGLTPSTSPVNPTNSFDGMSIESSVVRIPIDMIEANERQPRLTIEESSIAELAESIKEQGILQPIIVTKRDGHYLVICGERRLRASQLAGFKEIPAIIKEVAPDKILEMALVENIQREELNPIEEAFAYTRLIEDQRLSQEEVAKRVGKNRATITNSLRLLKLPKEIQEYVAGNLISGGHAKALVSLPSPDHQRVLAGRIVKENLSVRHTEELVRQYLSGKRSGKKVRILNPFVAELEEKFRNKLGTHVRIHHNKKNQGKIEIQYFSLDDLDRVMDAFQVVRD